MPRGNGTGPAGMGPMTGRGAGYCARFAAPGFANPAMGCGIGFGRGYRRMFHMTGLPGWARYGNPYGYAEQGDPGDEKEALSGQAAYLEKQLQRVRDRLNELDRE
jgi:hypothetical protein